MSRPRLVTMFGRQYLLPTWYPPVLVTGLAVLDQGRRLVSRDAGTVSLPDLSRATIVLAKPDHLGDLVQATALFRALRTQLPHARLVLVHGSWAREVASWLVANDYVHDLVTYDAAWLQASTVSWRDRLRVQRETRHSAADAIRRLAADIYLDIRCTSPSTLDLAIESAVPVRIGFGLRGRSWLYHRRIPYLANVSLGQNWLHALDVLGLGSVTYAGPVLPAAAALDSDAPIVVQAGSRMAAKEAPDVLWRTLLPALAERAPIMLVGNAGDRERFAWLRGLVPADRLHDAMGSTDFAQLVAATGRARAAVGVESMVAHLAVGRKRPTVVLNNPAASGVAAFPDDLDSLCFVNMSDDPAVAARSALAHLDRCLA